MQDATHLGQPDVSLAGLQIWVHRKEHPGAVDHSEYWLDVTAYCGEGGASVWVYGSLLMLSDLARWAEELEALWEGERDEAALAPYEPNLAASARRSDAAGHVLLRVEITPDPLRQAHRFDFEIDQSYLPGLVSQLAAVRAALTSA